MPQHLLNQVAGQAILWYHRGWLYASLQPVPLWLPRRAS